MQSSFDLIVNKYYPTLSRKSKLDILDLCRIELIPAGTIFIQKGKRDKDEYFIAEGVARSFLMNQEGDLITLAFFEKDTVLSPYVTRTQYGRALLNFEAITDCQLIAFDAATFEQLMVENLEIREFANTILRVELSNKINREIRLTSWAAKERLEQFRKDFHMLENRVPHPMIASYLGITNVSLSRLRKAQ